MFSYTNLSQSTTMSRFDHRWKPTAVETAPNCPRCDSPNTKFCYYNNYSLTQPRYFCKSCRRYWTKGGSLRNVPVGGGCRKNRRRHHAKSSSTTYLNPSSTKSFRPDQALDDMVGGSTSLDNHQSVSNGSNYIDLEVLYSKYLNPHQSSTVVVTEMPSEGSGSEDRVRLGELRDYQFGSTGLGLVGDCVGVSGVEAAAMDVLSTEVMFQSQLVWEQQQQQQQQQEMMMMMMMMNVNHMMMEEDQHHDVMGVDWTSFGAF